MSKALVSIVIAVLLVVPVIAQDVEPIEVVTTTTHATDVVEVICGELCNVTALMGPGIDPHLYQPTEEDVVAMQRAEAVFYNGLELEGKFDEVFEALGERNILTYAISDPVAEQGFVLSEQDGADDPHIWNDPRNWELVAGGVAAELTQLRPEAIDTFEENRLAYIEQLVALYEWADEALSQVPEDQQVLVTSHDAFAYYGDAFGWDVIGIQGISTEDEAGVGDIQDTIDFVVEADLPAVFIESSVPQDTIESVIEGAAAAGHEVEFGVRELFSDAMGERDSFAGTYIGMIVQNTATVLQSYGYDVPALPEELEMMLPEELGGEAEAES